MELMLNKTSPYARIARITAIEKGLSTRLQLSWVDPWSDDTLLLTANPLCRVPTLRTADGRNLTETLLIALYLDAEGEGESLLRPDSSRSLELAGLGIGLVDAAFNTVIARKHYGRETDRGTLGQRRHAAITRTLTRLEELLRGDGGRPLSLGSIAVGVALDYLAFRLPESAPGDDSPLRTWWQNIAARESFRATAFE